MANSKKAVDGPDSYNEKKVAAIKRQFGNELTFSIYRQLSDIGINDLNIIKIYGIKRTAFQVWKSAHVKVLGG